MSERRLLLGDCRALLAEEPAESVHACLTDPPYDLTTAARWGNAKTPPQEGTDGAFRRLSGGFLGKQWDAEGVAFDPETWRAVLRVLKPGGWLAAMGSDRTHHRLMVAIEDAGFEIRHCVCHCYASGFPKSLDVSAAIDRHLGAEREVVGTYQDPETGRVRKFEEHGFEPRFDALMGKSNGTEPRQVTAPATPEAEAWQGWGTALKPAVEFIVLARAPLSEGSVAANVLRHGTGGINIDACRVGAVPCPRNGAQHDIRGGSYGDPEKRGQRLESLPQVGSLAGRYPSTLWLSHGPACSETECGEGCPVALLNAQAGERFGGSHARHTTAGLRSVAMENPSTAHVGAGHDQNGPASRFYPVFDYEPPPLIFEPKPSRSERDAGCMALPDQTRNRVNPGGLENDPRWAPVRAKNTHPTVKSTALFRYLARLLTPPGGRILDPFAGSGTTGVATALEGFDCLLMEREAEYIPIIDARCAHAARQADRGRPLLAKTRSLKKTAPGQGQLFGEPQP